MGIVTNAFHFFAAHPACAPKEFFGIPSWYKYLYSAGRIDMKGGVCQLTGTFQMTDLLLVAMALLDMGLRAAGLVAVGFVIYGGIQYIISQGEPDKTKKAQETVINALIGLVLAIVATVIVQFIGNEVGKSL